MLRKSGRGRIEARRLAGYGFVAGMVLAPFLALVYGWNAGLGVMALALGATTYLAIDAWRGADPTVQPRLRLLIAANAALTLLCLVVLILRAF